MRTARYFIFSLFTLFLASCATHPEGFQFGSYSEAEALYNKGQYDKAIEKYKAYLDEKPDGNLAIISRYYIAKSYLQLGKKDEAKSIFEKIVKENPGVIWANFSETQLKELAGPGDDKK